MASPNDALKQQIAADPRVHALLKQRRRGSIPGYVFASDLRDLGYTVPNDWKVIDTPVPRQGANAPFRPYVFEENDVYDTVIGAGAGTLLGVFGPGVIKEWMNPGAFVGNAVSGVEKEIFRGTDYAPDGRSWTDWIKDVVTNPKTLLGAASLIPTLTNPGGGSGGNGGGSGSSSVGNPFASLGPLPPAPDFAGVTLPPPEAFPDSLADDAKAAYGIQKRRVDQTQPAFDALVYQAYGMSPMRYRGPAPEGYPSAAQEPVAGPYQYRGPQFG